MANNQKGKPSNGLPFLNIYNMTQKVIYLKRKVHKMKKYISIDIGGTAIKYGIICENAEIMMKETMKTEAEKGGSAILEKVFVIVEKLQGRIQEKASGICISTACYIICYWRFLQMNHKNFDWGYFLKHIAIIAVPVALQIGRAHV